MAKLNFTANPNHVAAKQTFEPIPAGDYLLEVVSCEGKKTSTGQALNVRFRVLYGPYMNRNMWILYNLIHPDPEVVLRAHDQMQDLFKAVGIKGEVDTDDLLHKPLTGRVYLTKPKPGYEQKNGVNKFRPADMLYPPDMLPLKPVQTPAQQAEATKQKMLTRLDEKFDDEPGKAPPPAPTAPLTATERVRALIAKKQAEAAARDEPPF